MLSATTLATLTRIYLANFYCGLNSQNWNYARKIAWTHLFCTINFFLSWRNATSKEFCNLQNNFLFQEFFPLMREYKLDFATLYWKWELRDHPFKTSVFFRGEGSKICQICRRIKISKFRKQIMVPKLPPKNEPSSLSWKITTSGLVVQKRVYLLAKRT